MYCRAKVAGVLDKKIETYADHLKSTGEAVVEIDGIPWMKYNNALVTATAMPIYEEVTNEKAIAALKTTGALFLRYNTRPNVGNQSSINQSWWQVICRHYDLSSVSANTRSKVHRGLKRMEIHLEEPTWLAENGYQCHVKSYARYKNVKPQTIETFRQFFENLADLAFFDIWVCRSNSSSNNCSSESELLGYIICLREDDGVFMHTIDLTPTGLHNYAAYAMIHTILEYYVNQLGIPVTNGSRSISHETQMQDFLEKFAFKKEFSTLNVIYRRHIYLTIRTLFPFRKFLRPFIFLSFVHKIAAALFQEEILRQQRKREK